MKPLNLSGPRDYLALLVRRRMWVIVPFLALSSAILLFTYLLPRLYVSDALILIQPRDVPEDFVKDLIAGTTEQRLAAIEQTVLSRTILIQILHEFEDKLPEYKDLLMDQKVLKLRNQIKVDFEAEQRGSAPLPVTYFRISYGNRSPELAQKIAAKVTSLFIEQDNRARENQVYGTTEFLSGELEKVSVQLKQSEDRLQELRSRHRYELPEQLDTNLRTLDRLNLQKQANGEALDRFETIRLNLERQISETEPIVPKQSRLPAIREKKPLVEEYRKKQLQLDELTTKYTARHPDVEAGRIQLQKMKEKLTPEDLEMLDKQAQEAESADDEPTQPNPVYQNLTAQLQSVKTELDLRVKERKFVEQEIGKFINRVQNAPQSQQEIGDLLRQNQDLTKQYDELKNHLAQARLSESLESRQKGSQFRIVDPANYPLVPTKPSKIALVIVGILFSVFAGLASAFIADTLSQKIWTQSEVESLLGVTVLAEIPAIVTVADQTEARKKRITMIASSVAAAAVYSLCLYGLYLKQGFVMRHLDAVLQRLY
jgi:polysaccharide biosynthesis transport protein